MKPNFGEEKEKKSFSIRALELLAQLQLKVEDPYSSFVARLYNDYHRVGYSVDNAKEAVLNNLGAIRRQYRGFFSPSYLGELQPFEEIEAMKADEFIRFAVPYIRSRYVSFAQHENLAVGSNVESYIRSLAEDIYYTCDMLNVPKSMMLLIGHQETFYHNLIGDHGKSEGPFQIYEPTKKVILSGMAKRNIEMPEAIDSLRKYRTFSTLMAAYHMSDLMGRFSEIYFKQGKGYVTYDLKQCAVAYNGSIEYYYEVLKKRKELETYTKDYVKLNNAYERLGMKSEKALNDGG